jgi:hypothetical protein
MEFFLVILWALISLGLSPLSDIDLDSEFMTFLPCENHIIFILSILRSLDKI